MMHPIKQAVYDKLLAGSVGASIYSDRPPDDADRPFVIVGGPTDRQRSITLDGTRQEFSYEVLVAGDADEDSGDLDTVAEACATALHGNHLSYIASGWGFERARVEGPVEADPDRETYGRVLTVRLEAYET